MPVNHLHGKHAFGKQLSDRHLVHGVEPALPVHLKLPVLVRSLAELDASLGLHVPNVAFLPLGPIEVRFTP
jgi:hypothetical protein